MVERKPSKLGVAGSSPVSRSKFVLGSKGMLAIKINLTPSVEHRYCIVDRCAQVAQSVEHVLGKDEVGGSIPLLGFFAARDMIAIENKELANHRRMR